MSARILIPKPLSRSLLLWLPPRRTWQQQLRHNTQQVQRPQTIETCPSPSCACQDMPPLDIERDKPLDGTMAAYHEHVVIPTGRVDWTSRIEEDPHLPLVKELKDSLGPKGRYSNVGPSSCSRLDDDDLTDQLALPQCPNNHLFSSYADHLNQQAPNDIRIPLPLLPPPTLNPAELIPHRLHPRRRPPCPPLITHHSQSSRVRCCSPQARPFTFASSPPYHRHPHLDLRPRRARFAMWYPWPDPTVRV